jgi:hypothetical protein
MKNLLIPLLFIIALTAVAQDKKFSPPDYKKIKKIIADKQSDSYYPKLMERFNKADSSLTPDDFRTIYYGYLFTDAFSPFPSSLYSDSLHPILQKDTLFNSDYLQLIKFEKLILAECPFNIRDLNILSFSYSQIGDDSSAYKTLFKLDRVIKTILSTGDGRKEETAWHVISVSHEYDILNVLGFTFGDGQSLTTKGCDYLQVQDNEYHVKGFYFDVNMLLEKEGEGFKK